MSDPVLIRPVRAADAPALLALADLLDTVNLPDDPTAIATIIRDSEHSFAAVSAATLPAGFDAKHASYTLVAVQGDTLLGTGSLFAFHGMPDEPHYFLRVEEQVVHSKQLNADRTRHLLRLGKDTEPWSEFGGLVVHPDARGKGVGKLLAPYWQSRLHLSLGHEDVAVVSGSRDVPWSCSRQLPCCST